MSPSWRDEIGIFISPHRVLMLRMKRGLKPALAAEHEHNIVCGDFNDWTAPLAVIDQLLERPEWQHAATRTVIADCWARYALVPWNSELSSAQEQASHARQVLVRLYGNSVSDWDMCISYAPPGVPRIACAVPADLLKAVRALHTRHRLKMNSLQPQLLASYEAWREHLPASGAWFVTVGDGTLAAARLGSGAWDRIHNIRIGSDWTRDLKRLQVFGRLASTSAAEGQVYVDAPAAWREVAGPAAKDLHWLEDMPGTKTTLRLLSRMRRMAA